MLQIAYKLAREQFKDRLNETFLVLYDDEPQQEGPHPEARRLSLDQRVVDPRREAGSRKHPRDDAISVESESNPKKADKSRSTEKNKDRGRK